MDLDVYRCRCGATSRRGLHCPICQSTAVPMSTRLLAKAVPQLCRVRGVAVIRIWGPPSHGKSTLCRIACRNFKRPGYVSGEERHGKVRAELDYFGASHCAVNPAESTWWSHDFLILDSIQTIEYDSAKSWGYPPHVLVSQVNSDGMAAGGMIVGHWVDADLMTQADTDDEGLHTGKYRLLNLKDRGRPQGRKAYHYTLAELYARNWTKGEKR